MIQDVYIIGATGNVGKELVSQIFVRGDTDSNRHVNPTRIVGLASSTHTLYLHEGISPDQAYAFTGKRYGDAHADTYIDHGELIDRARYGFRNGGSTLVFVDVTPLKQEMTKFHLQVIRDTPYGLVTANKNPIASSDYAVFKELTANIRRYGYRCSVMAGAEAIPFIRDARDVNDPIYSVKGCLSGTNGFITSELEKYGGDENPRRLSDIVREAHKIGYTEPHPRDDLSGIDVARKLVIIARSMGLPVGMGNVLREGLVPKEYFLEEDVPKFLDNLVNLDSDFAERMANAKGHGSTLRYVASIDMQGETPVLEVSLKEVSQENLLGMLKGTKNQVVITTKTFSDGYLIGPLPGAGIDVTAQNVRRDLLYLLSDRRDHP